MVAEMVPVTTMSRCGAQWFTDFKLASFPIEKAAVGLCELSVLHVAGVWQWRVRRHDRDVAEGVAHELVDAQRAAEAGAVKLG